jgi:hypothetical protein
MLLLLLLLLLLSMTADQQQQCTPPSPARHVSVRHQLPHSVSPFSSHLLNRADDSWWLPPCCQ